VPRREPAHARHRGALCGVLEAASVWAVHTLSPHSRVLPAQNPGGHAAAASGFAGQPAEDDDGVHGTCTDQLCNTVSASRDA
jgi:hypothetical protein